MGSRTRQRETADGRDTTPEARRPSDSELVGRKAPHPGPRFLRNPLVRRTLKTQIRADDEERELQEPWVLRVLNRLTGADLKIR